MQLAGEIVSIFQGADAALLAEDHFRTVFQQRELPADMPELKLVQPISLTDLLTDSGLAPSKSEARRLVQQGGIKLDGQKADNFNLIIAPDHEHVLQVGRRKFVKLLPGA
jgi:tyrosyl-tRNA synthetase